MDVTFETLYHFANENIDIIEIKRTDLPSDIDKSQQYFWLKYEQQTGDLSRLNFVSMQVSAESEERVFDEGLLHFNSEQALYTDLDTFDTETLQTQKPDLISEQLLSLIYHYFQAE